MTDALLSVQDLQTVVRARRGDLPVVRGVSFDVAPGEVVALVGESGSGKSLTMLSVLGLHPRPATAVTAGRVVFDGTELLGADKQQRRAVRGRGMAMVHQDPMTSLNPLMRVGEQVAEALWAHGVPRDEARDRAVDALGQVGIPRPERAARSYPHEFSGGMRQRVVIAMALVLRPRLLVADEPTTALDVTVQQQIIALVRDLQAELGMAVVWITHDLGVVARVAERTMVMYAGRVVEDGPTERVFARPGHPYTAGLLRAVPPVRGTDRPVLAQVPGGPPAPGAVPDGCAFHPRCPQARPVCTRQVPELSDGPHGAAACLVDPEEWT